VSPWQQYGSILSLVFRSVGPHLHRTILITHVKIERCNGLGRGDAASVIPAETNVITNLPLAQIRTRVSLPTVLIRDLWQIVSVVIFCPCLDIPCPDNSIVAVLCDGVCHLVAPTSRTLIAPLVNLKPPTFRARVGINIDCIHCAECAGDWWW